MQGPRLSSHYDRNVPDITLHLPQTPICSSPPSSKLPDSSSPLTDSTRPHPSNFPSNGSIHSGDPPTVEERERREQEEIERSKAEFESGASNSQVLGYDQNAKGGGKGRRRGKDEESAEGKEPVNFGNRVWKVLKRHAAFVGPGVIASVAYRECYYSYLSLAGSSVGS